MWLLYTVVKDSLRFHPENVVSNFTAELPQRVELWVNWKVAPCDLYSSDKTLIFVATVS